MFLNLFFEKKSYDSSKQNFWVWFRFHLDNSSVISIVIYANISAFIEAFMINPGLHRFQGDNSLPKSVNSKRIAAYCNVHFAATEVHVAKLSKA